MSKLAAVNRWLGTPFRACGRFMTALVNLTQTQIRALFSLGMLGGIVALSMQNMGLIATVWRTLGDATPKSLFGQMVLNQQFWNNAIIAGFGTILGLVVWGADYFRASIAKKELEMGRGDPPQAVAAVDATQPPIPETPITPPPGMIPDPEIPDASIPQ